MEPERPYARQYWPSEHSLCYETTFINLVSEFEKGAHGGYCPEPNFTNGYRNQAVMDAIELSTRRCWVKISQEATADMSCNA